MGTLTVFRDTFATELLLAGVPLERVSVMLGHSSTKVTEEHYSPWVRARQEQLEAAVNAAWRRDPVVLARTKGTPGTQENGGCQLIENRSLILAVRVGFELDSLFRNL
jgi:hypothetical protein